MLLLFQAAPRNIARFNMKERTYKFEPMVEQTIVHYATDGWLLHKGSEEAKKQLDLEKMEHEASARCAFICIPLPSDEHKLHVSLSEAMRVPWGLRTAHNSVAYVCPKVLSHLCPP